MTNTAQQFTVVLADIDGSDAWGVQVEAANTEAAEEQVLSSPELISAFCGITDREDVVVPAVIAGFVNVNPEHVLDKPETWTVIAYWRGDPIRVVVKATTGQEAQNQVWDQYDADYGFDEHGNLRLDLCAAVLGDHSEPIASPSLSL